jgi:hypothetical protein
VGRGPPRVAAVIVSILLRLHREQLAEGRLVGELEVVRTGERIAIRGVEELLARLVEQALLVPAPPGGER